MARKILFIMCDQLRWDYLGCYGHPTLKTPNIDLLAREGVQFDNAYVQSPLCGPSRMSFYTGRYVSSHGSYWNSAPLRIGEMNIGDHLNPLGMRTVLCGKTHMRADADGMARLGIDGDSTIGAKVSECGFDLWDRLDGVHPPDLVQPSHYNAYLAAKGYDGDAPWHDWANSGADADGTLRSGWLMQNARAPVRAEESDTETAYSTTRAIEFLTAHSEDSWCLHLSYIKPHWPYIAPEPYASMFGPEDVLPAVRSASERQTDHPVLRAFQDLRVSKTFARDEVRDTVIPAYMGLIKQIDDHLGRLWQALRETGQWDDTLIVFTSDHGDFLGDHWMGEKEFFYRQSVKVPMLIRDPSPAADATRGTRRSDLIEAIDLMPTFIDFAGGTPPDHILEGHSLLPLLDQADARSPRSVAISEFDFSNRQVRLALDLPIEACRLFMVTDGRFKAVFPLADLPPLLFDLQEDPDELIDIALHEGALDVLARLKGDLWTWSHRAHARVTTSDAQILDGTENEPTVGVLIGFWDQPQLDQVLAELEGQSRRRE